MSYAIAALQGNIVPVAGNALTLRIDDAGKIFRCDSASAVTVTVRNDLPAGFNCGFIAWGGGAVTLSPAPGAVNRSAKTTMTGQYACGSVMVITQAADGQKTMPACEYLSGGDFT